MQPKYPNKLKQIREDVVNVKLFNADKKQITQEMLAKFCGVTRQTIIAIESQQQMPSYPVALRSPHNQILASYSN